MAEFDQVKENFDDYVDCYLEKYQEYGGPALDRDLTMMQIKVTALQNTMIMIAAVPNSLKQCGPKEWATIKDRHDPRIADNIDDKSTLRSCIHVLGITMR